MNKVVGVMTVIGLLCGIDMESVLVESADERRAKDVYGGDRIEPGGRCKAAQEYAGETPR